MTKSCIRLAPNPNSVFHAYVSCANKSSADRAAEKGSSKAYFKRSTARVSLRKYFIPGCVGRGLDLDLRIRPAPAASGPKPGPKLGPKPGPKAPLGLRSKNKVFERPG